MIKHGFLPLVFPATVGLPAVGPPKSSGDIAEKAEITTSWPVMWKNPTDIVSRNLFIAHAENKHQPPTTFTFEKEDLGSSNSKFVVRGRQANQRAA
jgi:hypothetical protein